MGAGLADSFLDALPAALRTRFSAVAELEDVLSDLYRAGAAGWPGVVVPPAAFAYQAGAGVSPDRPVDPLPLLQSLHATDLYLACGCAAGHANAIAALERVYFSEIDVAASRMRAGGPVADEARQVVRLEILVPREGRPPGIAGFSGRGDLRSFVRVTAVRHLLRILRGARRQKAVEEEALHQVLAPADDPELEHLKQRYRTEFGAAFREAIRGLTSKERNLLRYQAIEGLSIDEVGALYGVHRATAARWSARAREALLTGTRRLLMKRLGLGRAEVESIMRLVQSRLDLSLDRLLASRA